MRDRSQSTLVSGGSDTPHIADIIGTCKNEQGAVVSKADCQFSVLSTGVSMGLAVLAYRSPTYWAGAFGPNGNNKRTHTRTLNSRALSSVADEFFTLLPDHLEISNIKINGAALPPNPNSPSLHHRKSGAKEYSVHYNGSLPLTFMVHHRTETQTPALGLGLNESDTEVSSNTVPLFAATDGLKMWLTHIAPIPEPPTINTNAHMYTETGTGTGTQTGKLTPRSGYNGYNHVGAGGIKLLGNSDPVATWADTTAWLNGNTEPGGARPYDFVLAMANTGTFLGHSLRANVHDIKGETWGYNAQFGMEGEWHGFSPDWENNFNWCFGVYPTNC
ncbi:hypothetical protein IFR05_012204 [Cadophora sp. M221]|nr:hypothetical protein IFR05_012204 [Cadophora sp. M221]